MNEVSHHWQRTDDQSAIRLLGGRPGALCTIVGIDGSFSRRLGAQLAIGEDGSMAGSMSDGCLEKELAKRASTANEPVVLRYGAGSPFVDFRLPCGAGIDVLVDPNPDSAAIEEVVATLDDRRPAKLTLPIGQATRHYIPSLRLKVFGIGPEAEALLAFTKTYGLAATYESPDTGLSLYKPPADFAADPWTAVILMFHDHEWEEGVMEAALDSDAFYIGAIGGRKTRERRRDALRSRGYSSGQIDRVRSPVGVIPATREPATLALSALADVIDAYERQRPEALDRPMTASVLNRPQLG